MNLYFRLLYLLLRQLFFPKKIDLRDPSVLHFTVLPHDLDVNLHMNNGRYLTLMDLGRVAYMLELGLFWATVKNKWFPVIGAQRIQFYRSLRLADRFSIQTRTVYWDSKWIFLEQSFFRNGKLVAKGQVQSIFRKKGEGTIPPEKLFAVLGKEPVHFDCPQEIHDWIELERKTNPLTKSKA